MWHKVTEKLPELGNNVYCKNGDTVNGKDLIFLAQYVAVEEKYFFVFIDFQCTLLNAFISNPKFLPDEEIEVLEWFELPDILPNILDT